MSKNAFFKGSDPENALMDQRIKILQILAYPDNSLPVQCERQAESACCALTATSRPPLSSSLKEKILLKIERLRHPLFTGMRTWFCPKNRIRGSVPQTKVDFKSPLKEYVQIILKAFYLYSYFCCQTYHRCPRFRKPVRIRESHFI